MVARDTLVGLPPGPYPIEKFRDNLKSNGIDVPTLQQLYRDLKWAREAIMTVPEAKDVKSWLANLMMFTASRTYQDGQHKESIAAGKLLAELTGALQPQVVEDNSVNIAAYLQGGPAAAPAPVETEPEEVSQKGFWFDDSLFDDEEGEE